VVPFQFTSQLYGPSVVRPNHHYAIHTPECVRDYGPLHEFWTFLFERMNKVLKSYKTSNHSGGELEVSFFREFQRTACESRLVRLHNALYFPKHPAHRSSQLSHAAHQRVDKELQFAAEAMFRASADDRGTVQAMSRELDEVQEDSMLSVLSLFILLLMTTAGNVALCLSTRSEQASMPSDLYFIVLGHLRSRSPTLQLHSHIALSPSPSSIPLFPRATFYDHVIVRGQKYAASTRNINSRQSLVMVQTSASGQTWVGELQHIFMVNQESVGCHWFGQMRWFIPVPSNRDTIWSQL
jgi:hypothetical protein